MHEPEPEPESVEPPTPAGAVSGQGDCAIVLWQYDAAEDDEMDLVEGELIEQIEEVNEGWWTGVGPGGKTGLFPSNYVEVIDDGTVAIALWDCEAANDNQISFKEGDKIVEIEFVSKDWWQGKDSAGNIGLFPATYVELYEQ